MAWFRRDQAQNRGGRARGLALGASAQGVSPAFSDEQRLAFGRVARAYDRARPSYPDSAIDEVIARAAIGAGDVVLEVGAGTGKATVLLAQRGLSVLALEPDPAMAALARENCRELPLVEVRELDFESHRPATSAQLVFAAQSWHWVDASLRYRLAAAALAAGGTLAAIWTLPRWQEVELRATLLEVYERIVPEMTASFPMHPGSAADDLAGDWRAEVAASGRFLEPSVSAHPWSQVYSAEDYAQLISTHQDHILLAADRREALLDELRAAIARGGGRLAMTYATIVCMARRAPGHGET